jgi:hypothetical protein
MPSLALEPGPGSEIQISLAPISVIFSLKLLPAAPITPAQAQGRKGKPPGEKITKVADESADNLNKQAIPARAGTILNGEF